MTSAEFHVPVFVEEVLHYLINDRSGIYFDCTAGGGGHSQAILEAIEGDGRLIGIDLDEEAVSFARHRLERFGDRVTLSQGNFGDIGRIFSELGIDQVNGILLDLGLSSHQLNSEHRGFSYQRACALDMRFDAGQPLTAEDIVNNSTREELIDIFMRYGEEKYSRQIANTIVIERDKGRITNTEQLAIIVKKIVPFRNRIKSQSRIFQALRIRVNFETMNLQNVLDQAIPLLKKNGRLVTIAYHSLEDKKIKEFFHQGENPCTCPPDFPICVCHKQAIIRILTKKAVKPSSSEIERNNRSRSARLRAAEKIK